MEGVNSNGSQFTGSTGENDGDVFNSDSVHLKQMLPQEIWLLVAKQLQERSRETVEYLANSSAFFENLLESRRTTYLFEKVFPLVTASVWKKEGLEGLPVADVLKCRGVCKQWNLAIDKLVPEKLQYFGDDSMDKNNARIGYVFKCLVSGDDFENSSLEEDDRSVENFLRHFTLTHLGSLVNIKTRNPWIWGHISVNIFNHNRQNFVEGISTMLKKYGSHLHSFSVQIESLEFFEKPTLLQEWLLLTPNLRKFRFEFLGSNFEDDDDRERNLEIALEQLPFPPLRFLEGMRIVNLPLPLFNQLVERNNHVVEFGFVDLDDLDYDIFAFDFPNLKSLKVSDYAGDPVELLESPQVEWRLETLKLFFQRGDAVIDMTLFQVIQTKFATTLVSLKIDVVGHLQYGKIWQVWKNYRLDLPKLRKIWINLERNPVCLDFLLPMSNNLEEISVNFDYELGNLPGEVMMETCGNIVQYFGFEETLFESNIWDLFKKLKKFEVMGNSGIQKYYRQDKQ